MNFIGDKAYRFDELERELNNEEYGKYSFLRVFDVKNKQFALMTTVKENLDSAYKSGDGILFYDDGEIHGADAGTEFVVHEIIPIKQKDDR